MVIEIQADEVDDFRTAVAGVEIDWLRIDEGWGPAVMRYSGDERAVVSNGGLDFSALLHAEIPDDRVGLQLSTSAPRGLRWCGSDADPMDLRVYRPTMPVFGNVPAGSRAVTTVALLEPLAGVADDLGLGELRMPSSADPLQETPEVGRLKRDLLQIAAQPEVLETPSGTTRLLESIARAIAGNDAGHHDVGERGYDSRGIVVACLDHVEATGNHQPTISELCRVAHASETRLRQAFVELLGLPPMQYFRVRVLSLLRSELLAADPCGSTVTETATSLGLTQFGRVAGRYRALFGETPRETLRRRERRRF